MRRIVLLILCFAAAATPAQAAGKAGVAVTECEVRDRAAEFEGSMAMVEDATRMRMRFTLQVRQPGKRAFKRIAAPGFDSWTTAAAGTSRYVFTRRVEALIGPASYRAMVRFRWVDERGAPVATARAYSRSCWQPDHRPNLTVGALSVKRRGTYVVLVANSGRSPSEAFDLRVELPSGALGSVTVESLAPRERRIVEIAGPRCQAGEPITAVADPVDAIDERSETDNALTETCP